MTNNTLILTTGQSFDSKTLEALQNEIKGRCGEVGIAIISGNATGTTFTAPFSTELATKFRHSFGKRLLNSKQFDDIIQIDQLDLLYEIEFLRKRYDNLIFLSTPFDRPQRETFLHRVQDGRNLKELQVGKIPQSVFYMAQNQDIPGLQAYGIIPDVLEQMTQPEVHNELRDQMTRLTQINHITPKITSDIVSLTPDGKKIRLIQRRDFPGGMALPGGFVEMGDTHLKTAIKEDIEEIGGNNFPEWTIADKFATHEGKKIIVLKELTQLDSPHRDPRRHIITKPYLVLNDFNPVAGDDALSVQAYDIEEVLAWPKEKRAFPDHVDAVKEGKIEFDKLQIRKISLSQN